MPLYLEIIFTIIGLILSTTGIVLGSKALINTTNINKQRNKNGDNYQGSTINKGITGDELVNIIKNLPTSDIEKIKNELDKRIENLESELKNRPKFSVGKEEPKDAKDGDLWFKEIE